jgi:serine protease AprX
MAGGGAAASNRESIDALMYGIGGRRFTQDSPILPDVWEAYRKAPTEPQDLLISPHIDARSGLLAQDLRDGLKAFREKHPDGEAARVRQAARVAHMPGLVAANLYIDELLRLVLTRTPWWRRHIAAATRILRGETTLKTTLFPLKPADIDRVGEEVEKLASSSSVVGSIARRGDLAPDLMLVAVVGGELLLKFQEKSDTRQPGYRDQLIASASLFNDWPLNAYEAQTWKQFENDKNDAPDLKLSQRSFWRVSLNRETQASITKSTLAVKADAARRLFNVSCKEINWAVLDSGIDTSHPAFVDWEAVIVKGGPAAFRWDQDQTTGSVAEKDKPFRPNRVVRTYDFTRVRDLLDPAATDQLFNNANLTPEQLQLKTRLELNLKLNGLDPKEEAPRHVRHLRERLDKGMEIDWALLEPFLLVSAPDQPVVGHGTHVAGIIGSDWREPSGDQGRGEAKIVMQGVCPDIRLIDMRVLGDDGTSNEFEVVAALQFIRHLNSRADARLIHGANLSLSTPHRVESYACGSTPICEECDRVWASGVVLVAAAGNKGHQNYLVQPSLFSEAGAGSNVLSGYHSISITDPGNAEGVITVGATHRIQPHQYGVSYFSSRGPTGDGRRKPDLVAPGEKIDGPLPLGGKGTGDGTSLAAPHVSGAAAMLMARYSELIGRPTKIKQILCETATNLGREPYFQGAGMLDILRALQSV